MKKLLASAVVLVLLISSCLIAAFPTAATELNVNYDDYDIIDGVILEYFGSDAELIVPSVAADGTPITKIDSRAFHGNENLTKVYICEGIIEVGAQAFEDCINITELSLPYSLEVAGHSAFRNTGLVSAVIPGGLKIVPGDFIVSGQNLIDLVISYGVEELTARSIYFYGTDLFIPSTVYKISGIAFPFVLADKNIYIANPDCKIGEIDGIEQTHAIDANSTETVDYSEEAPIAIRWNAGEKSEIKIYAPKDADRIKEKVNSWDDQYGNYTFMSRDQSFFDDMDTANKEKSVMAPTSWQMGSDGTINEDTSNPNNSNNNAAQGNNGVNNNGTNQAQTGNNNLVLILIACLGGFFILVVAAVVVFIVINSNKKKKKKKNKKKVKVEPEAVSEPEIVTENLEE